jgi:hypothetical protein
VRCGFDVNAGGLLDGENLGTVVAVDSAGNVSPAVPLSVAVDTRAPTVAAGTFVRVTRGARVLEVAEPGATIELVLALSEPAPVAPDVVLDLDGAVVAFDSDGGQGAVCPRTSPTTKPCSHARSSSATSATTSPTAV